MQVTIREAQTQLSRLIAAVERGEEVVIARHDRPVARLVPVERDRPKRKLGFLAHVPVKLEGFFDPEFERAIAAEFEPERCGVVSSTEPVPERDAKPSNEA